MSNITFQQVVKANEVGGILSTGKPINWEMVEKAPQDIVDAHKKFVQAVEQLNKLLLSYGTGLYL